MKRIATILLALNLVFFSSGIAPTQAPVAQGAIVSSIAKAGGCVGSAALSAWLSGMIDDGLRSLQSNIQKIGNDFLRGLFSGFVSGLLGDVPTDSHDQALQGFFQNYYYRDQVIARCLARQMLDNITSNTNVVIKTKGRDGGTTFIQNWTNFMTQSQYRGENIFRAELSTAKICPYLNDDVKNQYGVDPKKKTPLTGQNTRSNSLQPFNLQVNCTMPSGWTPQKYQQDFAGNGGWDAFVRLLEPQNNALGLTALSNDEIARQRALQQSADTNQAIAGRGYIGISGTSKSTSCRVKAPNGDCLVYNNIKTTGTYLADSAAAGIGAEYSWLTTAQGLNTIIEDMTQTMINRLFDQSDNSGSTLVKSNPTSGSPTPTPVSPPADALQKHPDQTALVAKAKQTLTAAGADLSGACGAFKITNAAALLIGNKAGLLSKPAGNNCQGYATDIIEFPDGYIYDVLGDAGGANTPAWNPDACGDTSTNGTCVERYRPAVSQ